MKLETDRFCPNPERVAAKLIDGEAIIIDLQNGTYYSMIGTGGRIWGALGEHRTLEEIVDVLVREFEVERHVAVDDVRKLLGQFLDADMIRLSERTEADASCNPGPRERSPYEAPVLHAYHDMEELLALDPPTPGALDRLMRKPLDDDEA